MEKHPHNKLEKISDSEGKTKIGLPRVITGPTIDLPGPSEEEFEILKLKKIEEAQPEDAKFYNELECKFEQNTYTSGYHVLKIQYLK